MKSIVCEMCGSQNLLKQDGVYVCQSCGTKYTVEEAKNLIIEGTVDVSGSTVKVDNTDALTNLRKLAARAREMGNTESAAKYYEMIAMQEPNDWEAGFYSVLYQSANTNIAGIASAANRVTNCIPNTMIMIKTSVPQAKQKISYQQVTEAVKTLCSMMRTTSWNHYHKFSSVDGAYAECYQREEAALNMLIQTANCILKTFGDKQTALNILQYCYNTVGEFVILKDKINQNIKNIDPMIAQKNEVSTAEENANSGSTASVVVLVLGTIGFIIGATDTANRKAFLFIGLLLLAFGIIRLIFTAINKASAAKKRSDFDRTYNQSDETETGTPRFTGGRNISGSEWKCPQCGKINQHYVGTCGCGQVKP